jgi:hypothetical protein
MLSADAELTIVVAPREKYSRARDAFLALTEADTPPFRLAWVDESRAPRAHRRWIRQFTPRPGLTHVALSHRAGANECRMRGFESSPNPFVLFLDNDAFLGVGALTAMLECMHATNASFVSPLILERHGAVHHAGGATTIEHDDDGGQRFVEDLPLQGAPSHAVLRDLSRAPTGALEMHGVLVRSDSLRAAGGLDTHLLSSLDCADLGLRLQGLDGSGWFEPGATLVYDSSPPRPADLPLYLGRWCVATVEHDIARFATTWGLDLHDARLDAHRGFLRARCLRVVRRYLGGARRMFGPAAEKGLEDLLDRVFDLLSESRAR